MQNSGHIQFNNPTAASAHWDVLNKQQEDDQKAKEKSTGYPVTEAENAEKLDNLVSSSQQFIYSIQTHMPLDFFPDKLVIDIHKVSLIEVRFLSKNAVSILIKDLNKVEVVNDFLFASIEMVNGSQTTFINASWLHKDEARQAQAIIQGLMIASKNDINLEQLPQNEILSKLRALGTPVV